jgi:AcrR family transcriptional regulator
MWSAGPRGEECSPSITAVTGSSAEGTRRYDSPLRRERSAETRERIVEAGSALVHDLSSWDWRGVTVRAVAQGAGVHERTVHRHFATEGDLRAAVLQRLIEESGVTVEGMRLDELPVHINQLFDYLSSFSGSTEQPPDPALADLDSRRKAAIIATVQAESAELSEAERALAAAMIDVLWGLPSYRRLTNGWELDAADAARGVTWVVGLVSEALRDGRGPGSADQDR